MPLHFIGAGINPDSTASLARPRSRPTPGTSSSPPLQAAAPSPVSPSSPSGIEYGISDTNDDPTGMVFQRCLFVCHSRFAADALRPVQSMMNVYSMHTSAAATACRLRSRAAFSTTHRHRQFHNSVGSSSTIACSSATSFRMVPERPVENSICTRPSQWSGVPVQQRHVSPTALQQ